MVDNLRSVKTLRTTWITLEKRRKHLRPIEARPPKCRKNIVGNYRFVKQTRTIPRAGDKHRLYLPAPQEMPELLLAPDVRDFGVQPISVVAVAVITAIFGRGNSAPRE